jgi:hypothetical protein
MCLDFNITPRKCTDVNSYTLTSMQEGGEWSSTCSVCFTPLGNSFQYPLDGCVGMALPVIKPGPSRL